MTAAEVERLVRGFVSRPVWVIGYDLPAVRPANPWPRRDCSRDRVCVGFVRSPRHLSAFDRRCPRCRRCGPGLPGDACPECLLGASDGVPA